MINCAHFALASFPQRTEAVIAVTLLTRSWIRRISSRTMTSAYCNTSFTQPERRVTSGEESCSLSTPFAAIITKKYPQHGGEGQQTARQRKFLMTRPLPSPTRDCVRCRFLQTRRELRDTVALCHGIVASQCCLCVSKRHNHDDCNLSSTRETRPLE